MTNPKDNNQKKVQKTLKSAKYKDQEALERHAKREKQLMEIKHVLASGNLIASMSDYFPTIERDYILGPRSKQLDTPAELISVFQDHGMYTTVTIEFAQALGAWIGNRVCLDPLAGRGWLAKGLRQAKVNVIASDDQSWCDPTLPPVTEVVTQDAISAIEEHGAHIQVMVMAWVPTGPLALQMMQTLKRVNPDALVVFIGEMEDQVHADEAFFSSVDMRVPDHFLRVYRSYKTLRQLNDAPYIATLP